MTLKVGRIYKDNQRTSSLVRLFGSSEFFLRCLLAAYRVVEDRDMPGAHDYACKFSLTPNGCTLSVFDRREAEDFCDKDPMCQAFVMTDQKTWTGGLIKLIVAFDKGVFLLSGRRIVHFKKGVFNLQVEPNMDLYVKPYQD
jgi:hypothetical protein